MAEQGLEQRVKLVWGTRAEGRVQWRSARSSAASSAKYGNMSLGEHVICQTSALQADANQAAGGGFDQFS